MTRKTIRKAVRKAKAQRTARPVTRRRKAASPAKSKAPPPDAIDSLLAAQAQALKLPIDPAWHGGVKFNLHLILRLGSLVDEFSLPDDAEPGPVFHA